MSWGISTTTGLDADTRQRICDAAIQIVSAAAPRVLRDKAKLGIEADRAIREATERLNISLPNAELATIRQTVIARATGFGFLNELLPPARTDINEITMLPTGEVLILPSGKRHFEKLNIHVSLSDANRAVEALLSPIGRSLSEATPDADGKLPRTENFGGARIKILHPIIAPGNGYPSINIRLFNPKPVQPEQIVAWQMLPEPIMNGLLDIVRKRARILIFGGTATGKTTFLSAIANAIPNTARIVKIEDPEEIFLSHPHVVSVEARPAPPGSEIRPYTLTDGVDAAMRMSPEWLIVGEVRTGDAALSLFRAQMSDHPGLSTFHAESPEQAVFRMATIMYADAGVRMEPAKSLFAQAVDVVIQIGWRDGKRCVIGIDQVQKELERGNVVFQKLWEMGMDEMKALSVRGSEEI